MPLISRRKQVLDVYTETSERKWVIPCFCSENLTTTEAILAGTKEYGKEIGKNNLPIIIGITNLYSYRSQTKLYSHTHKWAIGLKLFFNDLKILTDKDSPFYDLRVMTHLDHVQYDKNKILLDGDLDRFSSIMYDASELPFEENIKKTKEFVERQKDNILIEGACDEIVDAAKNNKSDLTTPEKAERYINETGVDLIAANLGTEHRADSAILQYENNRAYAIKEKIGSKLVLHGSSSVSVDKIKNLFNDGICKVNIWTTLERDSSPILFEQMIKNASKIVNKETFDKLIFDGYLGKNCKKNNRVSIDYFTTFYRQEIIFNVMKEIVKSYLKLWYS